VGDLLRLPGQPLRRRLAESPGAEAGAEGSEMTEKVRFSVSRICVAASFVMAFTSGMILCACPGWPAIGVGLAIAALWLRKGREPLGSMRAL